MSEAGAGGTLLLVSTPIGNLADLSERAKQALAEAAVLCCEDTRRTGRLLSLVQIAHGRLLSLHAHNEASRIAEVLNVLAGGVDVALVSDAGTPLLSDPGDRLVAAVANAGYRVVAVPGPSALLAALVVSGLGGGRFRFEGFLPRRGTERAERIATIASSSEPVICYESPQRVAETLADLAEICGAGRRVSISRELTKLHEETWRGSLGEAASASAVLAGRGEYVVVVDGASDLPGPADTELETHFARLASAGVSRRDAISAVEILLGVPHRHAYAAALAASAGTDGGTP